MISFTLEFFVHVPLARDSFLNWVKTARFVVSKNRITKGEKRKKEKKRKGRKKRRGNDSKGGRKDE